MKLSPYYRVFEEEDYLQRLAARKDALTALCRTTGWRYHCHHTDASAVTALVLASVSFSDAQRRTALPGEKTGASSRASA